MNFDWFMQQLERFLELEQRVRYCAVGLSDIARFKWYNDTLGHALGDRVLEHVARLLREHIRSDDVLLQEMTARRRPDLHARFGGDEFCFLIPDLNSGREAETVAERFRSSVERFAWETLEPALARAPRSRGRRRRLPEDGRGRRPPVHRAAAGAADAPARRPVDVRLEGRGVGAGARAKRSGWPTGEIVAE